MTTVKQVLTNTGSAVGNEELLSGVISKHVDSQEKGEHSHDCYNDFQIAIYALFKK